ncbi:Serine/threonine-protein kinase StkP [Enhygromyxa salina]|uniref:Serine/threonine-protein kinase StkP n=1 Tax=Enhygromyxa salina TaxID=215803 RepID=A0A2S9YEZ9_9BACT|nr:serine/threonine-protein kinase [Enhygromyxa salina]PRQ03680.1 Serine/threonine-protein kinase StkP [Enhygromyxa salina]
MMAKVSLEWIANRFRVLEELGHGGMGTVYRVVDTLGDERELALKTFRSDIPSTPERRLRFREEFRAMSRLRHPNTVEVYDCGFLDGQTEYLTMEYVRGTELSDMLRDGPLEFDAIYPLMLQLLLALEYIHSRLYIHRDIKPSNLRVREDGVLKLMDFGLMELLGSRSSTTVLGTASYMAPEVVIGGVLDTASDLYSVGCVLYEMVTGRVPFLGTQHETLQGHISQTPAPLRAFRQDAPVGLEGIVRRLLAKELRDRYASAGEVADDIARLTGTHRIRQDIARNESYLVSDAMVGRQHELRVLETFARDAEDGEGRSVFIGGPAGVGKSRLMDEVLIQAKLRGVQVIHAQCKPGTSPYEPFVTALRPLLSQSQPAELAGHRDVIARLEATRAERSGDDEQTFDKQRLAEDVTEWLRVSSARNAIVFAVDDLQWCDLPSLALFNHCIRNSTASNILCVATLRSDEASLGNPLWFTVQEGLTEHLELRSFDRAQVWQLIASMLPQLRVTDEFVDALYDATAGNAFFVTEVMRDLMEQGTLVASEDGWSLPASFEVDSLPSSIDAVVLDRIARLDSGAHELARIAAVLGRSLDRAALLALSGLDEDELFERVEVLTERQFLTREDGCYAFPHDRVREAFYEDTPPELRARLHQRCGEYLEAHSREGGTGPEGQLTELAFHFSRGRDRRKALDYTCRAGDHAHAAGSETLAIDYWREAIPLAEEQAGPDSELVFNLCARIAEDGLVLWPAQAFAMAERCRKALEARGNIDRVCELAKGVVAVVERLPGPIRERAMAELLRQQPYRHEPVPSSLKRYLPPPIASWLQKVFEIYALACVAAGLAGEPRRGSPLGERALELLPFKGTPLEGAMSTALAGCHQAAGHFDKMTEVLVRARALLFDTDLGGQSFALSARIGTAVFSNCTVFQGRRFDPGMVDYGIATIDELDHPDFYNQVWAYPCLWYAYTGRHAEAMTLVEKISGNCRRIGSPSYPWLLYIKPYLAWQRGSYEEARALVVSALRYPQIERMMLARECASVLEGEIYLATGELDEAERVFVETERRAHKVGMDLVIIQARIGRGKLAAARDDLAGARRHLREALGRAASGPARNPLQHAIATRHLAQVLIRAGELSGAEAALVRAMNSVTSVEQDNKIEEGLLYRVSAELAVARDDKVGAIIGLARAEAIFTELDNKHLVRTTRDQRIAAGLTRDSAPVIHPLPGFAANEAMSVADDETAEIKYENAEPG